MSSRGKNFRRRSQDDDDDDKDTTTVTPSTTTTTRKPQSLSKPSSSSTTTKSADAKPKKLTPAPNKLLSFADDEDTDDSPISRPPTSKPQSSSSKFSKASSSSSHKLTAAKDRLPPPTSSFQPQAGTYTKEALLELQKSTKTLAVSSRAPPPPAEPVIILKGLIKPLDSNHKANQPVSEDEDEKSDTKEVKNVNGSVILDQAAINAIRAKRERLRQAGAAAPDYISLDGGSNHGEAEGLSDEEPELRGRIAMLGEKNDSGKKGVFEEAGLKRDSEIDDDDEDEDEEDKIWEEEQFRKGLGKRMDDGSSRVVTSSVPVAVQSVQQQNVVYPVAPAAYQSVTGGAGGRSIGGSIGSVPGLDVMSISQQAEESRKALHDSVRRLKVCVLFS